jgi:L-rhamnose-H+ transport protein
MSSCFAFGLAAGEPIKALSAAAGTGPLWTGLPILCLVMFGGLVTNAVWCAYLIAKNRSAGEWFGRIAAETLGAPAMDSTGAETPAPFQPALLGRDAIVAARPPLLANFALCALAGTAWYFQFFFYTMGESQMGRYGFSSWTLHMASIIIFGTLWGFAFREWKDVSRGVRTTVWSGIGILIFATIIIGYGNMLGS